MNVFLSILFGVMLVLTAACVLYLFLEFANWVVAQIFGNMHF